MFSKLILEKIQDKKISLVPNYTDILFINNVVDKEKYSKLIKMSNDIYENPNPPYPYSPAIQVEFYYRLSTLKFYKYSLVLAPFVFTSKCYFFYKRRRKQILSKNFWFIYKPMLLTWILTLTWGVLGELHVDYYYTQLQTNQN